MTTLTGGTSLRSDPEEQQVQIQISTDGSIDGSGVLVDRLTAVIDGGLSRFGDQVTRVEVHLSDENAAKAGPADKRCVIEARPAGLQPVAVSHDADTVDGAVSGSLRKLQRQLDSVFGRLDDRKGGRTIRE